ncbi:hypothetical protein NADFUDRAFT_50995 [Nadsonia fulvescens var. elongata DSM 6958]|uniref:CUE domain-containing protein n=1 Tax=Nadsonia fulvescens var. elongata DSM 6958 TaxID=857566 RepID=A0A1E3PK81_9ASCO|nr:hypothetical protein NADFUDRAFT_50995 [Nadsonia fulvescens var. elongata DSM 6958]
MNIQIAPFPSEEVRRTLEFQPDVWVDLIKMWTKVIQYFVQVSLEASSVDNSGNYDHGLAPRSPAPPSMVTFIESYLQERAKYNDDGGEFDQSMDAGVYKALEELNVAIFQLVVKVQYVTISPDSLWNLLVSYSDSGDVNLHADLVSYIASDLIVFVHAIRSSILIKLQSSPRAFSDVKKSRDLESLARLIAGSPSISSTLCNDNWLQELNDIFLWAVSSGEAPDPANLSKAVLNVAFITLLALPVRNMGGIFDTISTKSEFAMLFSALLKLTNFVNKIRAKKNIKDHILILLDNAYSSLPSPPSLDGSDANNANSHQLYSSTILVSPENVSTIQDLFPQITVGQINTLFESHGNSIERVTEYLLENMEDIDSIPETNLPEAVNYNSQSKTYSGRTIYDNEDDEFSTGIVDRSKLIFGKKAPLQISSTDLDHQSKQRTLEAALKLVYEKDEDERDDTYDTIEAGVDDNTADGDIVSDKSSNESSVDKVESYLWSLYCRNKEAFSKDARKSKERKDTKTFTGWTDEQIEGWGKILLKDPRRERHYTTKYEFRGNVYTKPLTSYRKPKPTDDDDTEETNYQPQFTNGPKNHNSNGSHHTNIANSKGKGKQSGGGAEKGASNPNSKRGFAKKEQSKARTGNHSRKDGHSKKMAKAGVIPS